MTLTLNPTTILDVLSRRAAHEPHKKAFIYLADGESQEVSLTYGELQKRARAIAACLQQQKAVGKTALLFYPPGLEFISAFFGCLCAGVIAVPTYPPRGGRDNDRIYAIIKNAEAEFILTTSTVLPVIQNDLLGGDPQQTVTCLSTDQIDVANVKNWQNTGAYGDTVAFLQYTSGSTGNPKGVIVTHANLLYNQRMIQTGMGHTEESTFFGWLPLFHDMGLVGNVIHPLFIGALSVLMSPVSFLEKPLRWLQGITKYKARTSGGPNFGYELCNRKISPDQRATLDLSSWRVAFNGAEPVRADTLKRFTSTFASQGFRAEAFFPCYGLAEATLIVSGGRESTMPTVLDGGGRLQSAVSCGRPVLDETVLIVDPHSLNECREGEVGEVWVSGANVAAGYWKRPEESERVFRAFTAGSGLGPFLRTGDLGFLQDGELFISGRLKDLIIIRGRNYYPQDIEVAVEQTHPALRPGCNAAFSVETAGEERLVVVQEIDSAASSSAPRLTTAIAESIAGRLEISPYAVVLIKPGSIPKTSSGKIRRAACRSLFLENTLPVVDEWRAELSYVDVAPSGSQNGLGSADRIESWLSQQLSAILNRPPAEIDVERPLIEMAFDSVSAVELGYRIEDQSGVAIPMSMLLGGATLKEIADRVHDLMHEASPVVAVSAGPPATRYPLTNGQKALWFLHQSESVNEAYLISRAITVYGELDDAVLTEAFQWLSHRHSCLRTSFHSDRGRPFQLISDRLVVDVTKHDASGWNQLELNRKLVEEGCRPVALDQAPLWRLSVFERSPDLHVVLLVIHHLITDYWSLAAMMDEFSKIHQELRDGLEPSLPDLGVQYSDYVSWQTEMLESAEGERLSNYWLARFAGETPVLDLPLDRPRPAFQTYRGASLGFKFDSKFADQLRTAAAALDLTPFMLALSGLQLLLHRYSGQSRICVGTPTSGRSLAQFRNVLGYFVNPIALDIEFRRDEPEESARAFLLRNRQGILEAFDHQEYPFQLLVERLHPDRDPGRSPVFQVMLTWQRSQLLNDRLAAFALGEAGPLVEFGALQMESLPVDIPTAQFEIAFTLSDTGAGVSGRIEYKTDLFDAVTIERLAGHFRMVMESLIRDTGQRLTEIARLTENERAQLLDEWNDTGRIRDENICVHEMIESEVRRIPDAIALVTQESQLSYGEMDRRANQLARHLVRKGIETEGLVGVCMERSLEMGIGLLGILKAGGAYVPLDPGYPVERLMYMGNDAGIRVLLTHERTRQTADTFGCEVVSIDGEWERISWESGEGGVRTTTPENLIYVIYTSGSTGAPKGAMNVHNGLVNRLVWMQHYYNLSGSDRVFQKTPFSFDVSVWEIFWPLVTGASVFLASHEGHKEPDYLVQRIVEQQITTVHFVPSMLRVFLGEQPTEIGSSLRRVICSGEALPADLQRQFQSLIDVGLFNLYGPTEASIDVTFHSCDTDPGQATVPIGRPIDNTSIYLVTEQLNPVPIGVKGLIFIGGEGLARGYWNRPSLTAERFIPDPFCKHAGARLYETGDLGRHLPDGEIEYVGRVDNQVKLRGFRIELGEIESVLAKFEEVDQCAVLVKEDLAREKRIVAYVVWKSDGLTGLEEMRSRLKGKLPEYMIPSVFVSLDRVPLMPNGKLDRKALPAPVWTSASPAEGLASENRPEQEFLKAIWEKVLGLKEVGIRDNYFALGGDSIRSIQVLALARERGINLTLENLFQYQTIKDLSDAMRASRIDGVSGRLQVAPFALVPEHDMDKLPPGIEDAYPLSTVQAGLLFHSEFSTDYEVYVTSLHLRVQIDTDRLRRAIRRLVCRHQMLRSSFHLSPFSEALQLVQSEADVPLVVEDLRHLAHEEQDQFLEDWIEAEKARAFRLDEAPLVRLYLHLRTADTVQFTLSEPYLDGWSVALFLSELFREYSSSRKENGSRPQQPRPSIGYSAFVKLEQEALESPDCQEFWARKLEGAVVSKLPQRLADQNGKAKVRHLRRYVPIAVDQSDRIKELARAHAYPVKSLLLAAHARVVSFVGAERDVVVGLMSNGRPEEKDGDLILGLFLNTLPLRMNLTGGSWLDLIALAFDSERELLPFRRYPLATLQREHGGALFETAFNFTHFHVYHTLRGIDEVTILDGSASDQTYFPLTAQFTLDPNTGDIQLGLEFSTDHLCDQQVEAIGGYYQAVLRSMSEDLRSRYEDVVLLSMAEREQLLVEWNDTGRPYDRSMCVHEMVESEVERIPDAIALVHEGEHLSYDEMNSRGNRLANYLVRTGIDIGQLVGVCMERGMEMMISLFGILKAGGAYVPLDPGYPLQRLAYMVKDAGLELLLTQKRLHDRTVDFGCEVLSVDKEWESISLKNADGGVRRATPGGLMYVIYTSGSTGTPKGAMIQHASVANFLTSMRERPGMGEQQRLLSVTTLSFDIAALEIFLPLIAGGVVVLTSRETAADGIELRREVERQTVDLMQATPSTWGILVEAGWAGSATLKLLCGGEALPVRLARELRGRCATLWNMYGPTETTIWSASDEVGAVDDQLTIGRPIGNTEIYLLNHWLASIPMGVAGQIHIGGEGVCRGYWKRPWLTAASFVPNPFSSKPGARLYATGDLGRYLPDGRIEYLGRADRQVKMRGFRIELAEIELVLSGFEQVAQCAVLVRPDQSQGMRLVAYVVWCGREAPEETVLRSYLKARLPDYMVPTAFVFLDALPVTPNGKLNRNALPDPSSAELPRKTGALPERFIQRSIAEIWADVLKKDPIALEDDFFELGGHSLTGLRAISRIREEFVIDINVRDLFASPTLGSLADLIENRIISRASPDELEELLAILGDSDLPEEDLPEAGNLIPPNGRRADSVTS
jgi:amino acid adenylation domain-containing protein